PGRKSVPENREVNMGRPPRVVVIAPRVGAGSEGEKPILAALVGEHAAGAGEIGIERGVVLIDVVDVASAGVGLPDFEQGVGYRPAGVIENPAGHDDALADR